MRKFLLLVLPLLLLAGTVRAQKPAPYLNVSQLPDGTRFLPAPPEEGSPTYAQDTAMYFYAKAHLRTGERALRAIREGTTDVDTMALLFSGAFGRELSREKTPQTLHLLGRCIRTFRLAATNPKATYMRLRPYVFYKEGTLIPEDEEHERHTGSYPSGHSIRGWGMALVLSALNPERQDTLLRAGYEWGQSRVIAGYHWQSDVDASRHLAAACFARLQGSEEYRKDFASAWEELHAGEAQQAGDELLLRNWIRTIASDPFGGRKPMTPYEDVTVNYLAGELEKLGLEPAFDGSWFQPFGMISVTAKPEGARIPVKGKKKAVLNYPEDVVVWTAQAREKIDLKGAEYVFCGFGIDAPEYGWKDFEGVDVKGKIVIAMVNDPGYYNPSLFRGRNMTYYGRWVYKFEEARRRGKQAGPLL